MDNLVRQNHIHYERVYEMVNTPIALAIQELGFKHMVIAR